MLTHGRLGRSRPAHAEAIVAFETRIAEASWTRAEQPRPRQDLQPDDPGRAAARSRPASPGSRSWPATELPKRRAGHRQPEHRLPEDRRHLRRDAAPRRCRPGRPSTPSDSAAPYLSKRFADANCEFRQKTLAGQPEQRPRWKRAVDLHRRRARASRSAGSTSRATSRRSPRPRWRRLVADLRTAMKAPHREAAVDEPGDQGQALEKLAKFNVKIGYPPQVARLLRRCSVERGRPLRQRRARRAPSSGRWQRRRG